MTPSNDDAFNLLDAPWIGCVTTRGKPVEVGLLDLFTKARTLRAVVDPSPLVRVALHRPLLAILYRTQRIESLDDWLALWKKGWDAEAIESYLEKWRKGFDLFSSKSPFYQRADLDLGGKTTPLAKLVPEFTAGGNKQVFDHSSDNAPDPIDPATAARYLVAGQYWSIGGGQSGGGRPNFMTAPLAKGASILPQGKNLAETLLLNLTPLDRFTSIPRQIHFEDSDDAATWEQQARKPMEVERPLHGVADYLTWLWRYVRLIRDPDGQLRFGYIVQGERIAGQGEGAPLIDPFHAYEQTDKGGYFPKSVDRERAAWRDSASLFGTFEDRIKKGSCAALTTMHEARRRDGKSLPKITPVYVGGIALPGGQPPPDLWIGETFDIPIQLLESKDLLSYLESALTKANDVQGLLRNAVRLYATKFLEHGQGSVDKDAAGRLSKALTRETAYWSALELPFRDYLRGLADPETLDENENRWFDSLRKAALDAFESSLASQDATGRHLRARNAATAYFYSQAKGLYHIVPKEESNE